MSLIASVLHLSRQDMKSLRITDPYSLHRVVYDLFSDVRTDEEKMASQASGILYAEHENDFYGKKILLLSNREPAATTQSGHGRVQSKVLPDSFLQHEQYRFKVIVNPTRRDNATKKLQSIKGREAIAQWFEQRAKNSWGFEISLPHLQVDRMDVLQFHDKEQRKITLAQAHVQGTLKVVDRTQFLDSFARGIGRGKAFGCGLLQLVPMTASMFDNASF